MHILVIVGIIIVILLIVGFAIYKFRGAATAPVDSEVTINTTEEPAKSADSSEPPATVIDSGTPITVVTSEPTCADPAAYYYHYAPDVKAAGVDALAHWNSSGHKEGRKSCYPPPTQTVVTSEPTCADPAAYYYHYAPDVKAAGVDALAHWNSSGHKEGRKSCYPPPTQTVAGLTIGGKYSIKSDIGKFLTPNSGVIDAGGNTPTVWTIEAGSTPGTVNLRADNGQWASYSGTRPDNRIVKAQQVFMTPNVNGKTNWTPVQAGGQYGFSSGGNFMTRCNGCGVLPNIITAHETGVNGWSSSFTLTPM